MEELEMFSYSGENIIIQKGMNLTKIELISRFKKLGIDIDVKNNDKQFLARIYDDIIKNDLNKIKIFDVLKKDTKKNWFN